MISKEILKDAHFVIKQENLEYPRGVNCGHPSNFDMLPARLAIFYKPSWGMFLETKMIIIIKNSPDLNLYDSTHSYVVDSDFWSDFSNHVFFVFFEFLVKKSKLLKTS